MGESGGRPEVGLPTPAAPPPNEGREGAKAPWPWPLPLPALPAALAVGVASSVEQPADCLFCFVVVCWLRGV